MSEDHLLLNGQALSLDDVEAVARHGRPIHLGDAARSAMQVSREHVHRLALGQAPVYGVNTGFGSLSRVRVDVDHTRELQRNLVRSHAAGVGEPLPFDVVRAMLCALAGSLSRGCSGVSIETIEQVLGMLNRGITPVVPSRGSVGASGDLAPLAHAVLVMMGEGEAWYGGSRQAGGAALAAAGLQPIELKAKEGLALLNGTHLMAGIGALALRDIERVLDAATAATALAIDACRATDAFLDDRVHIIRNQPGQRRVAGRVREYLAGSTILEDHREDDPRVQDPYSLRAAPQVLGAAIDAVEHARAVFERELGAVTDNPLVFTDADGEAAVISAGNFHGMPLAISMDLLAIALAHVAGIAERRIYWLLKASDSENPLNEYLSPSPGLHSGLMIVQYTAAACCNELQTLAAPASVANIPTSAGMEDYNSMGVTSAHQLRAAVELTSNVVAMELLTMTEALDYQHEGGFRSGAGVERVYERVRSVVPRLIADRPPSPDIAALVELIRAGEVC